MKFVDAVTQYVADHIGTIEQDYQWDFSLDKLPVAVNLEIGESWFQRNIDLRKTLHENWKSADSELRLKISNWYIRVWGGIKGNRPDKLSLYASATPDQLIERKLAGIASWSKTLSIVDPTKYAIFDARVSSSLNSIQMIKSVDNPQYFPDLPSQNTIIVSSATAAKLTVKKHWKLADKNGLYSEYNSLLKSVATEIGGGATLQTVEMVLFSRAEILAKNRPN